MQYTTFRHGISSRRNSFTGMSITRGREAILMGANTMRKFEHGMLDKNHPVVMGDGILDDLGSGIMNVVRSTRDTIMTLRGDQAGQTYVDAPGESTTNLIVYGGLAAVAAYLLIHK